MSSKAIMDYNGMRAMGYIAVLRNPSFRQKDAVGQLHFTAPAENARTLLIDAALRRGGVGCSLEVHKLIKEILQPSVQGRNIKKYKAEKANELAALVKDYLDPDGGNEKLSRRALNEEEDEDEGNVLELNNLY